MIHDATYVLPIRCAQPHSDELTTYLEWVSTRMPLVIVDGSPPPVFDAVHHTWSEWSVHVPPSQGIAGANGKVRGVLSSVAHVDTPFVVIADLRGRTASTFGSQENRALSPHRRHHMDRDAVDANAGAVHRRDLARTLRFALAVAVVVALVLVGLDNRHEVRIGYVLGDAQAPLWVVVVGAALAGMIVAALVRRNRP